MKNSYTAAGRVARVGRPAPFAFVCRLLLALLLALPGRAQAQAPAVSSFSPTSGPVGTVISLTGTALTGATAITFSGSSGNVVSTGYTVASATSITGIVVPGGAVTGTLTVTTPGGTSPASPASFTVCAAPVALAQNVSVMLDANGNATVTATQVNNGSTANCGPAAAGNLSLQMPVTGTISKDVTENGTLTLTAPAGCLFTAINFASYGTPTGSPNGTPPTPYAISSCHATNSVTIVGNALLGKKSGSIDAKNAIFGDPCRGTVKKLAVTATYAADPASVTYTCANLGPNPVTLTVTDAGGNTSTAPATVTVSVPPTPTTTWTGGSGTDWNNCANWSYGKVPDVATNVIIPTTRPSYPSLPAGTYPVLSLTIDGSLTTASGATLQVNGNFTNNGTATLSGPVAFVGSAATQTLGGSNVTTFATLTVNKASGTVSLARNIAVGTVLTLTSGTLITTSSYQVTLGGSASISESETSYVIGKTVATRTLVAGTAEAFSGLGLTLTPATGSTAPGSTVVTRTTGTALTGAGTSQSILRAFAIAPAVNTGLNVTLAFTYFTHELNGIAVADLAMFKSMSSGKPWIPQRGTTAGSNVVTKTGITDLSTLTLGTTANPLPVELAAFTATAEGPAVVRLAWATASEKNSASFEVERSLDGRNFSSVSTVAAAGSSSSARVYGFLDAKLPTGTALLYYRLKQVDADGTFAYSLVRAAARSGKAPADAALALFPNPAHTGTATLAGALPGTVVAVYDALGRAVASAPADATGTAALALPAGLPAGVYVVRAGSKALRLTVE